MNNQSKMILLAAVMIASVAQWVCAGIILNSAETWSTPPPLAGWTNAIPTGTEDATLSNPSSYLRVTFNPQGGQPVFEDDVIYANGANYTGSYQGGSNVALRFTFYAEDVLPALTEVYMHSAVSGFTWEHAFNNTVVGLPTWQDISFNYNAGWVGPGTAAQFWADLANIDWIGVYIVRKLDTIQQDYGIDNWEYYEVIPEPGVFSILAASFLSCAIAFRKRRQHIVEKGPRTSEHD